MICGNDMNKWNKEQIENYLRHETTYDDVQCHKIAKKLSKDNLLNKLIISDPNKYTERVE